MNKTSVGVFLAVLMFGAAVSPIAALDISVQPNGSVRFFQPAVLGEAEDKDEAQKKNESKSSEFKKEFEAKEKSDSESKPKEQKEQGEGRKEMMSSPLPPIKVLPENANSRVRILPMERPNTQFQINIEEKVKDAKRERPTFRAVQTVTSDRVRLELPAELKSLQSQKEDQDSEPSEKDFSPEVKEIETERQQRTNETIQLQTEKKDDGTTEVQFQSRDVTAKATGKVGVTVDPQTRNLSITTPGGQEQTLIHLPDQAIARMQAAGFISPNDVDVVKNNVKIQTTADGHITYSLQQAKKKRFLGIIPHSVNTQVQLDDSTGKVSETEINSGGLFGRLINVLSL